MCNKHVTVTNRITIIAIEIIPIEKIQDCTVTTLKKGIGELYSVKNKLNFNPFS